MVQLIFHFFKKLFFGILIKENLYKFDNVALLNIVNTNVILYMIVICSY